MTSVTEASGSWYDPDKTTIRLRRAGHWFWTTLLETESYGIGEHLQWTTNNALDVTLDFGCLWRMTRKIDKVGSINIAYHLSYDDKMLAKGCPDDRAK